MRLRRLTVRYGVVLGDGVSEGVRLLHGVPDDDVPLADGVPADDVDVLLLCGVADEGVPAAPGVGESQLATVVGNGVPLPGPPDPLSILPQATGIEGSYIPSTIAPWMTTTSFVNSSGAGVAVLVTLGVAVVAVPVDEAVPLAPGVVAVTDAVPLVLVLLSTVPDPLGVVAPPRGIVALALGVGVPLVLVPLVVGVVSAAADAVLLLAGPGSWFA